MNSYITIWLSKSRFQKRRKDNIKLPDRFARGDIQRRNCVWETILTIYDQTKQLQN